MDDANDQTIEGTWDSAPVRLTWLSDGTVRLVTTALSEKGPENTEIFAVKAPEIKRLLVADGGSGIYLWVGTTKYVLAVGIWKAMNENRGQLQGTFVADTVINTAEVMVRENAKVKDFQEYLKNYGVKTQKSSLVKIILITVIAFILILAILIAIALMTVSPKA